MHEPDRLPTFDAAEEAASQQVDEHLAAEELRGGGDSWGTSRLQQVEGGGQGMGAGVHERVLVCVDVYFAGG